jgi:hypothetical protein
MSAAASLPDPFDDLATARKPLESGDTGGRHQMVRVGDELTGVVTKAEIVDGKYGKLRLLSVDPHRAISDGVDTTAAGETEFRVTGYELEPWYDAEQPQAGNLVSIVLAELRDTGKDSPMKHYAAALLRDSGAPVDPADPGVAPELPADGIPFVPAGG